MAKLNEKDFTKVKAALAKGMSNKEAQDKFGFAGSTVWRISRSETFDDYRGLCKNTGVKQAQANKAMDSQLQRLVDETYEIKLLLAELTHYARKKQLRKLFKH